MEIGEKSMEPSPPPDARTLCQLRFLQVVAAARVSPCRLRRCKGSARLRIWEGYRRLHPDRPS